MSIHLPDLIADQQLRNAAAAAAAATGPDSGQTEPFAANTTHLLEQPLDSASLLAKLRAQLVRREAAASDVAASDFDRNSIAADDINEQDFFDLTEMMEYGASEGHLLSRHASTFVMEGRPPGDVFEIGDLLGPGLEHDGHVIQIAETTLGFVDQNADLTGSKLEVVRKLGEGSYAAVYLVKEVSAEEAASHVSNRSISVSPSASRSDLPDKTSKETNDDADLTMVASSEDLLSSTLKADGTGKGEGFHNSPALEERRRKDLKVNTSLRPGKEFALKCLCKRDLPEDMLEVQRLEATIHQSIPSHPNIVTLYRTYETPDWLFLVLEYCPGQDLYYWLEQAQDTGRPKLDDEETPERTFIGQDNADTKPDGDSKAFEDDNYEVLGSSLDATPPSPSILASTSGRGLLSKRRIRLIARMFRQICDAVQFCHDRGVSHRDLKPENFIVEDRRTVEEMQSACPDTSISTLVDSTRDGDESQVIVKMTDFGLATADDRCDDFDCGSKPYMAFECANNVSSSYDPKQADIWSLGVVLLNLLFHRSPFTEPSMNCASFAAYCEDPVRFLMESFDGLTETVARYLSENVFCSVTDSDDVAQKRISAGEFSRWACGLVDHMGLSGSGPGRMSRGASVYATIPLMHSRTGSMSTLPSMLSSPRPRARSLARDADQILALDATADGTFRAAFMDAAAERRRSLSPCPDLFTPDVLPSPTFTPLPHPSERNPFDLHYATIEEAVGGTANADRHEQDIQADGSAPNVVHSPKGMPNGTIVHSNGIASGPRTKANEAGINGDAAFDSTSVVANGGVDAEQSTRPGDANVETQPEADVQLAGADGDGIANGETEPVDTADGDAKEGAEDGDQAESITTSNHSKRRKRGARKGRTLAKQLKRSQSIDALADVDANDPAAKARERERTIRELAQASESLARQMSKMTKPSDVVDGLSPPQITLSRPTAEAAARYSLQGLAQVDAELPQMASSTGLPAARSTRTTDDVAGAASTPAANWDSAAARRDRMSEQRKTGGTLLADADRSRVMSWRDRNQSAATLSSLTSSVTSVSSHSSLTSATSSIYSTASAPAALTRKDFSARNRTRGSGFGLDTISEREKAAPTKKEVDAKYLAGIFGGGDGSSRDKTRKEAPANRSGDAPRAIPSLSAIEAADASVSAPTKVEKSDKASKLFGLLSDGSGSKVSNAATSTEMEVQAAEPSPRLPAETVAVHGAGQRSVSVGSTGSTTSNPGVAASFVSRFRRPASSSSSSAANKAASISETDGAAAGSTAGRFLGASLGMRRDASTSTSSLHRVKEDGIDSAPAVASTTSNGSGGNKNTPTDDAVPVDAAAAAKAPKKRGMGKFLLGVRDSIKNF
uniref:Protein kinase n=2 Tax=Kalmanozyma brasiliensis (strain GHG001) TaxID=1365824 RepID=V5GVM4_KALBG